MICVRTLSSNILRVVDGGIGVSLILHDRNMMFGSIFNRVLHWIFGGIATAGCRVGLFAGS